MTKSENSDELSMEEILASVRQIVSENPGKAKPTGDLPTPRQPQRPVATAPITSRDPAPPLPSSPQSAGAAMPSAHFDGLSDLLADDTGGPAEPNWRSSPGEALPKAHSAATQTNQEAQRSRGAFTPNSNPMGFGAPRSEPSPSAPKPSVNGRASAEGTLSRRPDTHNELAKTQAQPGSRNSEFLPPNMRQPTWARVQTPASEDQLKEEPSIAEKAGASFAKPEAPRAPIKAEMPAPRQSEPRSNPAPHFSAHSWPLAPEPPNALVEPIIETDAPARNQEPDGQLPTEIDAEDRSQALQDALGAALRNHRAETEDPIQPQLSDPIDTSPAQIETQALSLSDLANPPPPAENSSAEVVKETREQTSIDSDEINASAPVPHVEPTQSPAQDEFAASESMRPSDDEMQSALVENAEPVLGSNGAVSPAMAAVQTSEPSEVVPSAMDQFAGEEENAAAETSESAVRTPRSMEALKRSATDPLASVAPALADQQHWNEPLPQEQVSEASIETATHEPAHQIAAAILSSGDAPDAAAASGPEDLSLGAQQAGETQPNASASEAAETPRDSDLDTAKVAALTGSPTGIADQSSELVATATADLPDASPLEFLARGLAATTVPTPPAPEGEMAPAEDVTQEPVSSPQNSQAEAEAPPQLTPAAVPVPIIDLQAALAPALQEAAALGAAAAAGAGQVGPTERTMEDVVADLLRPMLQQWLADNMPRIIEKALRVEVETLNDKNS